MKTSILSGWHRIVRRRETRMAGGWRAVGMGVLLGFWLMAGAVHAAERSGRTIYRQECARCHGRNGEGVRGKYDDPLRGHLDIPHLARLIEKTMPDDDPGSCQGPDALAVARYVFETFYSPEAQARRNPPRIELLRLSNRQYATTLADTFLALDRPAAAGTAFMAGGLDARYYNSRGPRKESLVIERVDPRVDFRFGVGSPDTERIKPEEFSIQWNGSVMAEETGDYEFVVVTPNGARLWVNDEEEPLIDAWVASGDQREHRARLRLLGGRAYPLRLEFFKSKDREAAIALEWKPPRRAREVVPARCLSRTRVPAQFVVATPFPADDSSAGYERGAGVSQAWDEATTQAAIEAAHEFVARLDRWTRTKPGDSNRVERVQAACGEFVAGLFRQEATESVVRTHVRRHFESGLAPEEAAKRCVLWALKSPRFLYPALGEFAAPGEAVAARLALALWDSMPDKALHERARRGGFRTMDQVREEARRMVEEPRARAKMLAFLHHWLQVDHVEELTKDPTAFPGFTPELASDLRVSLNLFLEDVVWGESGDFRELLLADALYVNGRLAEFYGLGPVEGEGFVKIRAGGEQRAGVLTHPFLLAAFAYPKSSSPIHRGVFLTRNIVGRGLRPPPVAVAFKDAEFAPDLSMRQKVEELTRSQACQTCHAVINPLGFTLEHFDGVGRFRTTEQGRPVDAASDYVTDDGRSLRLTRARDVAEHAASSSTAQAAFVEQLFHHVVNQPALAYGADTIRRLREAFAASGYNVRQLLVEIACVGAMPSASAAERFAVNQP